MEAVGLASGVAGLITLALQVSGTITEYANAVKDRAKNVKELREELSLLAEVLIQLKAFLETEPARGSEFDEGSVLQKAVADCKFRVDRIATKLKPISGGKLARTWDKVTWPFEQKDILQMVENLRRFTNTFQFALSIRGFSILSKTSDDASKLLKDMLGEVKKVGEMSKLIPGLEAAAQESLKTSTQIQEIIGLLPMLLQQAGEVREMSQAVKLAEQREQERRKSEILEWLIPASSLHKHIDVQKRRASDTGQWFLEHHDFVNWTKDIDLRQDLLCVGGPGRGKTVLCSRVIDHLRRLYENSDSAVVYYYCDFSEQQGQTPLHLACCVLRQLCQWSGTIPTVVSEFYTKSKNELRDSLWFQGLQIVVQKVIATFRQCVIIVDAFDETDVKEQRPGLFQTLAVMRASQGIVRVFATTRPHIDIEREFDNFVKIEVSANVSDLRQFLSKKIDEHPHSNDILDANLKNEIVEKLCLHADGMFLLPALQIDRILDQVTKGDIKRALNNLSTNLEDVFRSTLERIRDFSPQKRDLAYRIFMWISHARRPLSTAELRHALAVRFEADDIDEDDMPSVQTMLDSCCGLIELDGESNYVRFVHFSLYEHLREDNHGLFTDGELTITRTCLKYLAFDSLSSLPFKNRNDFLLALDELSFLEYASQYWGFHARELDTESYKDLALPLLSDSHSLLVTAKVRDVRTPDLRKWKERMWSWAFGGGGGISLAASFGLAKLTRLLIDSMQTPVLSARNMYGSTPLHECALNGFIDTAEVLIEHGADLLDSNKGKATPFYLAVSYGQLSMCRMLLNHDRRQLDTPCRDQFTPLHKACDIGAETVSGFLLQSGALINAKEETGMTPLHLACRRGHLDLVKMLVEARAEINARSDDGVTALDLAATGGFLEIAKYLVQHGADVANKSRFRWTVLHRAARSGRADIVKFLLANGADLLAEDKGGHTPLILAVKGGSIETVKLLLEHKPEIMLQQLQHKEKSGSSTKSVAFYTAHYDIHKYLRDLEHQLQGHDPIFHPSPEPLLPLTHAIEAGVLPMVQALIKAQPDIVNMRDESGCLPLHIAFIESQREIAEEILSHGVSINVRGYHQWTPVHIAASFGSVAMLSLALSYDADIHAMTETMQTPLHKAASGKNLEIVVELLRCGCDPSVPNNRGLTPVHIAAYQNFEEALREMLKPEWSDKNLALAKDHYDRTPRVWAEFAGHLEIAAFLRVEERRARKRIDGLSLTPRSLSRMSTSTSSEGGTLSRSTTLEVATTRRNTAGLLTPPAIASSTTTAAAGSNISSAEAGSEASQNRQSEMTNPAHRRQSSSHSPLIRTPRLGTPTPVPSPSPTPTPTPFPSSGTSKHATRGEDEHLLEMERRYAEMALEFESD